MHESFRFEPNSLSDRDQAVIRDGWNGNFENDPNLTPEVRIETISEDINQLPDYFTEKINRLQSSDQNSMKYFLIDAIKLKELANAYIAYTRRYIGITNPQKIRHPAISGSDIQSRFIRLKQDFENALKNLNQ